MGQHLVGSNPSGVCITDELYQEQNLTLVLFISSGLVFDQQTSSTDCISQNCLVKTIKTIAIVNKIDSFQLKI